ncbi:PTS fructose transporter subunit IIABC [Trichococcus pasteurii]|uniref:Phosphotransferase system fructose-specific iib subunit n=1 Tax=Trichococcus pasteurii TaxID=43064 RepID=A0A1W1IJN0_9LACT|nr:fructose-specific PTS transporter subunit EIIC [Trichococcus pasteurii]SFE84007.1 PTS system D-fructose-specific IIA component (F1P-forming), Frc family (TC 4.A.2.1.4)/PTS system D-fructose-specific IIB component (F1P-forming), Frc family (TC 4.A.2.1.4)/PTS system D-fructose-specific IIC component (F1P-forming), Frc family (TC 4.A.2.1.4) [Trichococcus pasteurii]SLM52963.1 phosphotransferase system fructose-specific iib subunit [Trichococcus pasteurii]SSB93844.1 phosphotransferase system fruct
MKINDILLKELMIMDLQATTKEGVIDEMIAGLSANGIINDAAVYKEGIMKRESQTSTGLGDGIAMPHAKNKAVIKPAVVFAKSAAGVDYASLDGQPAHLFFMIAAPEGANNVHLEVLASLSRLLINPDFTSSLKKAQTPEEVQGLFAAAEAAREAKEQAEAAAKAAPVAATETKRPFVIAVTACPTGIAHTYMAEDSLKQMAEKMGVDIRVETNGSDGVKNPLTADEIRRADGVIVAADKKVEMARFNGKHVLQRPVSDGINKAEELITKAMRQEAPILNVEGDTFSASESDEKQSIIGKVYKDLMNGISHMLPFVVGGGIMIAISFLFETSFGADSPLFISFMAIGGAAFSFLIPILAGYIALSIADRPGLLPGMAGGYLAVQANAGFLGGLIAGFLAGYIMVYLKKAFKGLPRALDGMKTILLYPVFGLLITGLLMYFLVGPVFSTINTAMITFLENLGTGNAVLLGAVLGGMMAIDMGGPFNKAAYAFSIGIFTDTGDGSLMAAVMAGGMIPPLAIGIATLIFKNKFTDIEQKSGLSNILLGLSFITEGAIPFAAADPMRVIGSSIVGSAIAGGLTQLWAVSIPAPHGGLFVITLANRPLMFLLALLIGTAVSALMLGFWKQDKTQEVAK